RGEAKSVIRWQRSYIRPDHPNPLPKPVQCNISLCKQGKALLQFDQLDLCSGAFHGKEQAYNSRTCSKVSDVLCCRTFGKGSEQQGIHRKTITFLVLVNFDIPQKIQRSHMKIIH